MNTLKEIKMLCNQYTLTLESYKPNKVRLYCVYLGDDKISDYLPAKHMLNFLLGMEALTKIMNCSMRNLP
jgi:hypothetical protein